MPSKKRTKRSKRKKRDAPVRKSPKKKVEKTSQTIPVWQKYEEIQLKPLEANPLTTKQKLLYAFVMMTKLSKQFEKEYSKYEATKEFFN